LIIADCKRKLELCAVEFLDIIRATV